MASAGDGVEPSAAESDDSPLRRDKPRTTLRRGSRRSRSSRSSSSSSSSTSSSSSSSNSSSSSSSSSGSSSDSSSSSGSSSQSSSSRGWSSKRGSGRGRAIPQSPRKSLSPQGACSGSPSPEGSAFRRRPSESPSYRCLKWWSSSERSVSRSLSPQGACSGTESSPRASSRSRSPTDVSSRCHSVVQVSSSSSPRAASMGSQSPQRASTDSRFHSSTSRTRLTSPDRAKRSTSPYRAKRSTSSPSSTIQRNGNEEVGSTSSRAQEQAASPSSSQLPSITYGLKVSNIGSSAKSRYIKNFLKQRFKSFGNLLTATIQGTGKDRYGLLFYKYGLDREKALKAKVRNPFGKVLQIECWDGPPPVTQAEGSVPQISSGTYGLRITNIDIGVEQTGLLPSLKWAFRRFGKIVSAAVHGEGKDRYGLVFYKHQKEQTKALGSQNKFKTAIGDLKISPWNGPPVKSERELSHIIKQEKIEAPNERHHKDKNLLSSMSVDRQSASDSAKPSNASLPQSPSRRFALKITNIGFHFKNTVLKKNLSHPVIKRFLKKEFMRFGNVTSLETYGSAKSCYALVYFSHRSEQIKAIANKKRFCFLTKKSKVTEWNGLPPVKENRHNLSKSQLSCNDAKISKSHSSRYSRSRTPLSQIAFRRARYSRSRSPLLRQSGIRRSIHSRSSSPSHKSKNRSSRSRARHSRSRSPDLRSRRTRSRSPYSYRSALVSESKYEQKAVTSGTPRRVVIENEMTSADTQLAMSRTRLGLTELSSSLQKASLTLWINNLAETITSADLCTAFQPFGEVQHVEIREGFRNRGKQAFLQYSAVRSVYKAIEQMNGRFFGDKKLQLDFAYPRHATNCVWVYGLLLAKTTQLHLTVTFEEFGPVLKLLHDPIQGTALVLYNDTASAKKAVEEMDMNRIAGHRVRVGYANLRCQLGFCHSMESSGQPVGNFYQLVGASED